MARKGHPLGYPVTTTILLERGDHRVLKIVAAERGCSVSELVRIAVREAFAGEYLRVGEGDLVQEPSR